jgi:hypothetical protein
LRNFCHVLGGGRFCNGVKRDAQSGSAASISLNGAGSCELVSAPFLGISNFNIKTPP